MESLGRVNAALVSLGVPAGNEINHRDWTDGTNGVGGYPLPTKGRKVDSLYDIGDLRANTKKWGTAQPVPPEPNEGSVFMYLVPDGSQAILVDGGRQVKMDATTANGALKPLAGEKPLYFKATQDFVNRMGDAYGDPH